MQKYDSFDANPYGVHMKTLELIDKNKNVLEIGCSTGQISRRLLKNNCEVIGIEIDEDASKSAKSYCKHVINEDVEKIEDLPYPEKYFDFIVYGDVLEHLKAPEQTLKKFRRYLKDDGFIVVSLPNIANWKFRFRLLLGRFQYQESGILDKTHLRFFTLKSSKDLLNQTGFEVVKLDIVPETLSISDAYLMKLIYQLSWILPNFFATEFILKGKKKLLS